MGDREGVSEGVELVDMLKCVGERVVAVCYGLSETNHSGIEQKCDRRTTTKFGYR